MTGKGAELFDRLWRAVARVGPRTGGLIAGGVVLLVVVYYLLGMAIIHTIDDDPRFAPGDEETIAGGSQAVAMAAALIRRETRDHPWVANDPFFLPGAALDNMPNYQQGIVGALAVFAFELKDQIGRTRGSSQVDPDLQEASGLLQYSGTKWRWDLSTSFWPISTSEEQYRKARKSLIAYNRRLAAGDAVFERRADNLLATLDRIALDIGALSAAIDDHLATGRSVLMPDTDVDDLFYGVKGRAYAYALILRGLRADFATIVEDKELGPAWAQTATSLDAVVALDPWVVTNGKPDGWLWPNHLTAQGFYLLRARTQLRELTNILLK
ncbi:MAG: DUF2333 family protein [Alphaproteobacteria bacterium]|nr:MAG: DUF2333 family protein [Alphaproteobacteria bacterium]